MREHRTWRRLARAILTALLGLALGASLCSCGDGGMGFPPGPGAGQRAAGGRGGTGGSELFRPGGIRAGWKQTCGWSAGRGTGRCRW